MERTGDFKQQIQKKLTEALKELSLFLQVANQYEAPKFCWTHRADGKVGGLKYTERQ